MKQSKIIRLFLAALLLLVWAAPVSAEDLIASGDSENIWIVRTNADGKGITVHHRRANDQPESKLQSAGGLTGTLIPGGAVAGDGFLWLFYANGSVQGLRAVDEVTGRRFTDIILPTMPAGVTVRSLAVTGKGAWALVRIEDPKVLKAIDFPPQSPQSWNEKQKRRAPTSVLLKDASAPKDGAPKDASSPKDEPAPKDEPIKDAKAKDGAAPATPATPAPTTAPVEPPAPEPAKLKVDRLLYLGQLAWEKVDLPEDWNPDIAAWLVTRSHEDERSQLVTAVNGEKLIRWYRWEKADEKPDTLPTWISTQQTLETGVRLPPTSLNGKLCVVNRVNSPGKIELSVAIIRPERVTDLGSFALDDVGSWAVTPVGDQLALVTAEKSTPEKAGALFMKRINDKGIADANPIPLAVAPPSLEQAADLLVYVIVLALVTPILLLMWKREAGPLIPQLPKTMRIAELAPRGLAAMIDLAPCLFIASVIRGVSFDDLLNYWPGRSGGAWERMVPGAIAIGLYIGHTFFSELFTARTLGKSLMGLRVTGLRGEPPDLWQVLARNVFKVLDLILMPLLIFAIISPNRQRLGDVVARTLIVTRGAPEDGGPPGAEKKEDDDENRDLPPDPRPKRPK